MAEEIDLNEEEEAALERSWEKREKEGEKAPGEDRQLPAPPHSTQATGSKTKELRRKYRTR